MPTDPFDRDHAPSIGAVEWLRPNLRVVTAPNASPMTFTGTRSYVLGDEEVVIIDPGPDDPAHLDALVASLAPGARVVAILVTHAHLDHSAGAMRLGDRFGTPVLAHGDPIGSRSAAMQRLVEVAGGSLGGGEGVDLKFRPDRRIGEGAVIEGAGWRLEARHLPGHLGDHLVFDAGDFAFSGDLLMGWASTMISPPDGDLAAFRNSIDRLRGMAHDVCYAGHGAPVHDPATLCSYLLAHRDSREFEILSALERGPVSIPDIVTTLYADVDAALHPAASRTVLAHLVDLEARGRVVCPGGIRADGIFRLA